ncbi:2664_t:CDS:1, partial [Racocetra persica]
MSNWPSPNPEIQHLLRKLPNGSAGHPPGPLWQAFNPIKIDKDKKPKARCIFCNPEKPISGTAAIMISHIKKCENVRTYLINAYSFQQSVHSKHNQQDIRRFSSDTSITPSMSISNHSSILDLSNNNIHNEFYSNTSQMPTQSSVDICKSNQLLLEAIIEGGAPFSFVDTQKFWEFVYSINNWYHVPARKQLSNNILDGVHENVKASIQQFICKSNWITVVTDGWTNIRQDHLVNFVAIGKNRRSELVKIKDTLGESQTSTVILKDLEEVLMQISIEKINAVITDGAANYIRMKNMLVQKYPKIVALPCTAHESNLLVCDLLKHTYMKLTISLAIKIIVFFRKSTQAIQYIRA